MKFDDINSVPETKQKEVRSVGEAIDIKQIVKNAFDQNQKNREERLKNFLKKAGIDQKKVFNDSALKSEFDKILDMLDKKDKEEVSVLRDKNSSLQQQLDVATAIRNTRDDLATKIAKKAGINDPEEIKKISAGLKDISNKYNKSQDLG